MRQRISRWRGQGPAFWWAVAFAILSVWVAARLGVFSLSQLVSTVDGVRWLPNALAGVDHPFHIARAETLRRALLDGEVLRWIGHHQGGYPVEFYPLGVAWLDVGIWALSFGFLSIPQAHTIVVAIIFLLPGVAFALLAGQDGWTPRVAVIALAFHVLIPGDWWHGGYTELVQWGLITNVAGAVAALFCLACLNRFVWSDSGWSAAGAVLAAAAAVYTNPRSLIALAVVGAGVWLTATIRRGADARSMLVVSRRIAIVAILAMLVAAPELVSLARFADLYQFVLYEWYSDPGQYLQSAMAAVSTPVFLLAVAGGAFAVVTSSHIAARTATVALVLYALVTLLLMSQAGAALAQLEPTRLMPFQRLLTAYLAAVAIEAAVRTVSARLGPRGRVIPDIAVALLVVVLVVGRAGPMASSMPLPGQTDPLATALYPVERAAVPQFHDFEQAIRAADRAAAPGTTLLVLGSALSWHQQLWAPLWTIRPLLYDNWLWFWHDSHAGTPGYTWAQGHHYPDPERALDPDYLARHGIGAVVVTGPATRSAAESQGLEPVRTGTYNVFRVREPVTIVTFDGTNAAHIELNDPGLVAIGASDGGVATIRRNWYPRWRATVNDEPVPLSRTADGYMTAPLPAGAATLRLTNGTGALDWLARVLCLIGLIGTFVAPRWSGSRFAPAATGPSRTR